MPVNESSLQWKIYAASGSDFDHYESMSVCSVSLEVYRMRDTTEYTAKVNNVVQGHSSIIEGAKAIAQQSAAYILRGAARELEALTNGCSRDYASAVSHVLDAIAEIDALPDPLNREDVFRILRGEEE